MSTYNPYIQWLVGLKPDRAADVRRWFGYLPFDTSHDFEIGMDLNGMWWREEMFEAARRIPKLRHGFVPKASPLALAIFDISQAGSDRTVTRLINKPTATTQELKSHNNVVNAFSRAVAPDVDRFIDRVRMTHPDRLPVVKFERTTLPRELPDDILITAAGSTYRCKPGEKLRGQQVAFNEVELHVDELKKLIEDNPPKRCGAEAQRHEVDKLRELLKGSILPPSEAIRLAALGIIGGGANYDPLSSHTINLPPLTPPPERPYDEILAAVQKVHLWRAEERRRQLTDGQVMQLCAHFQLYSLEAIQEFIEEYQR